MNSLISSIRKIFSEKNEGKQSNSLSVPYLCEDVVGQVFSFLVIRDMLNCALVCREWNSVYRNKISWQKYLLEIFPETEVIPQKYSNIKKDFYRISYLYVTKSSWRFDKSFSSENVDFTEDCRVSKTRTTDHLNNRTITTFQVHRPKNIRINNKRVVKSEILEIQVNECNAGNFSIGVVNDYFKFDGFSFIGFGTEIEDYKAEISTQTSYGYASNGLIRSNGESVTVPGFSKDDNITMIWTRKGKSGHRIEFYRNGVFTGACNENHEIRTQWLKCSVTLYNAQVGDKNEVEIVTKNLKVGFWENVFPKIVEDIGKEALFVGD